MKKWFMIKEI